MTGKAKSKPKEQSTGGQGPRLALSRCGVAFLGIGVLSACINLLMLSGSFYMLEIYDRVLPSRSLPTLIGISGIVLVLFAFQGIFDLIRGSLTLRIATSLDESLSGAVFRSILVSPMKSPYTYTGLQPIKDLDKIKNFLSGPGPAALCDLPWIPLYIGLCFLFHPLIGATALTGAILLLIVTLAAEVITRKSSEEAAVASISRTSIAEMSQRNAEVIRAMGMEHELTSIWITHNSRYRAGLEKGSIAVSCLGAVSRILRTALQSVVLGTGAYLVIQQQATSGVIIAASILTSRALAPVDLAIGNWKAFVMARQSWKRLCAALSGTAELKAPMALPPPRTSLLIENASVGPPGVSRVTVANISLSLNAGQGLGIIGPSASGKSSLVRMLVGVWRPLHGKVRLDGSSIEHWRSDILGKHVGYLPQEVELFAGTVAQNIARFRSDADPESIVAAAKAANVHSLIQYLPDGYETQVGDRGAALSAGQRQRIALARALFGNPFLVVLDEPNSNLDTDGEDALTRAILNARASGSIVIVVAHRPSALAGVDRILALEGGRVQVYGPKDEVLHSRQTKAVPFSSEPNSPPSYADVKIVRGLGK